MVYESWETWFSMNRGSWDDKRCDTIETRMESDLRAPQGSTDVVKVSSKSL